MSATRTARGSPAATSTTPSAVPTTRSSMPSPTSSATSGASASMRRPTAAARPQHATAEPRASGPGLRRPRHRPAHRLRLPGGGECGGVRPHQVRRRRAGSEICRPLPPRVGRSGRRHRHRPAPGGDRCGSLQSAGAGDPRPHPLLLPWQPSCRRQEAPTAGTVAQPSSARALPRPPTGPLLPLAARRIGRP